MRGRPTESNVIDAVEKLTRNFLRRPSSSALEEDPRQEYIDAENVKETDECLGMYSSCKLNIYDFITFQELWSFFLGRALHVYRIF